MGFIGWLLIKSRSIRELNASPDGSISTFSNTLSIPNSSSASASEITLEILWMVKRRFVSPMLKCHPSLAHRLIPSAPGLAFPSSGMYVATFP